VRCARGQSTVTLHPPCRKLATERVTSFSCMNAPDDSLQGPYRAAAGLGSLAAAVFGGLTTGGGRSLGEPVSGAIFPTTGMFAGPFLKNLLSRRIPGFEVSSNSAH
jgi:hypothetical protein